MAYEQNFLRLVVSGTLYTSETFSFSMALIQATSPAPPAPTEVPSGVVNAINLFWTFPGLIGQNALLDTIKLNEIGTDGRYVNDETVMYEFDPLTPGASNANPAPQVALAVTLDTATRRGRASRGRFYLPAPAAPVGPTGVIGLSDQSSYVNRATAMLDAINDAMAPWQVGVVSDIGLGEQRRVTNVRVGRVLDTIRSRRRSLDEQYVEGAPLVDTP